MNLLIGGNVLQLVSSCENFSCWEVVVVAEVISDNSTGSNKVIVLVEQDTGPWEFSW